MNPLEIYKRLPRINCGECPAKTCMAFAMRLSNNEGSVSQCIKLTGQGEKELEAMLSEADLSDWKEKFVEELIEEITREDLSNIAEEIGALIEGNLLKIRYMGKEVTVGNSGFENELDIWDKLLILMYIRRRGNSPLSGRWVAFRDLKDGSVKSIGFKGSCELPLARMFDADRKGFLKRLLRMGAEKINGFSTELSYVVYLLPRIPFLLLLWPGDEDFEPTCCVLLDSTATEFLDVEALMYLGQALVRTLKKAV